MTKALSVSGYCGGVVSCFSARLPMMRASTGLRSTTRVSLLRTVQVATNAGTAQTDGPRKSDLAIKTDQMGAEGRGTASCLLRRQPRPVGATGSLQRQRSSVKAPV